MEFTRGVLRNTIQSRTHDYMRPGITDSLTLSYRSAGGQFSKQFNCSSLPAPAAMCAILVLILLLQGLVTIRFNKLL